MKGLKNFSPMKMMDEAVFSQLDKVKDLPAYQKIIEFYNLIDDTQQSIANAALMFLVLIIPLLFVLIFAGWKSSLESELDIHEKIIEKASTIVSKTNQVKKISETTLGSAITSETALKTKISTLLNGTQIDPSKIIVSNYDNFENNNISEVSATVQFKELSNKNISKLFEKLYVLDKFKPKAINIKKDPKIQLLEGTIDLVYYGRLENNE